MLGVRAVDLGNGEVGAEFEAAVAAVGGFTGRVGD